jgi:iron complex outermembrane receptor protein
MICAPAAYAQTTSPQPTQADNQVAEIVVTATKRETSLSKTPIAISAFSQDLLNKQQVKDVTGLAQYVPSLHFAQQGDQGAILLTMRGIGNDAAYTEVADPEVAIYVDGIYSPRAQGASALMYDMERVEVLRGPRARCSAATPPSARSAWSPPSPSSTRCRPASRPWAVPTTAMASAA